MKTLIIFAKAPVPGFVKTRLAKDTPLDEEQVCALYEAFLKDTITVAALTEAERIAIHYTPADMEDVMRKIVKRLKLGVRNEKRFTFRAQEGETFTEKVSNSFKAEGSTGEAELVMIGADAPTLKPGAIDDAFDFIYSRSGVVLGPSYEGGLYLIGHPSTLPIDCAKVFAEGSEIENFVNIAKELNVPIKLLPETLDVDVGADLITLMGLIHAMAYQRQFETCVFPTHTNEVISGLGLSVVRDSDNTRSKKIVLTGPRNSIPVN